MMSSPRNPRTSSSMIWIWKSKGLSTLPSIVRLQASERSTDSERRRVARRSGPER
jgi:hypothetical protein